MEIWWNSQPMKVAIQCCRIRLSSKICHGRILPFLLYRRVTFTFSKRARSNHPSRTSVTSLGQFHCSLLTPLKLMLILSIMHLRFWTMLLNLCLMVLNHSVINLKQILLYSSISQHLLIEIVIFHEICQLLHSKGRIKQYYDMQALLLPIFIQKFWFFWWKQQTTWIHCISWCCLYDEKEINFLRLQWRQDSKCCFFGRKKHRHHLLI